MTKARVVLASLPWATYAEPSLGLALLKATLSVAGVESHVRHLNLRLLHYLSPETYSMLSQFWGINDFLFTYTLDEALDQRQADCLIECCTKQVAGVTQDRYSTLEALLELCLRVREEVIPVYLDDCASHILELEPTLVGFTCMFDQTLASVALAKILKARSPDLMIVLGGYALEGVPGNTVLRSFPWIDAIARGDGEPQIALLADASVGIGQMDKIPGVITQGLEFPVSPPLQTDLNAAPLPDYEDWFADLETLRSSEKLTIRSKVLPVEASRGCWWGQHKHCVFCGIDEETLKYRAKEQQGVLAMLRSMRGRYGDHIFRFSDYILPKQYYHEMLDHLAAEVPRFRLMGEIKANQTADRLRRLSAAGFVELQPGIESFSTEVLRLMDKGVRAIYNVVTLKAGYQYRIQINYNILYGLPNEEPEWYLEMLAQLPMLYHLTPPVSRTETVVTRFAPLQANPGRFNLLVKPRHHRCYDMLFSEAFFRDHPFSLDDYAYYFARHFDYSDDNQKLYSMLVLQVENWKRQHRERDVYLYYMGDREFFDSRFGDEQRYVLNELEWLVYLNCDSAPVTLNALSERIAQLGPWSESAIARAVETLTLALRIVWREGDHLLGLAVPGAVWHAHKESNWPRHWTANYC